MSDPVINKKLVRITTVPMALKYLLPGQMRFMQNNGFDVLMISAEGKELADVIKNEQCRHIVVPMTRRITPLKDLKCLFQLIRIFRKEKPDIVHTHTPKAGLLGMLAARFCKVKIRIHTIAGLPMMVEKGFKYQLLKLMEKLTAASANHIWPNSNSLLNYINNHQLADPEKLKVIGKGSTNGIDIHDFNRSGLNDKMIKDTQAAMHYSSVNQYLLFIGRLVADKGIVELVNTFKSMQQTDPLLRLVLVGSFEDTLDPLPTTTIKEIKSNQAIIHINWTDDVKYYMFLSDFFIFPSYREGFPNVLLQAGAMGLPVLCSRIAGNIDIITESETGLLFECGNEQQMRNAIDRAIAEPKLTKDRAVRLRQLVITDFRRENIWENLFEAYKSLLN